MKWQFVMRHETDVPGQCKAQPQSLKIRLHYVGICAYCCYAKYALCLLPTCFSTRTSAEVSLQLHVVGFWSEACFMQLLSLAIIGFGIWLATRPGDCEKYLTVPVFVIGAIFLLMWVVLQSHSPLPFSSHCSRFWITVCLNLIVNYCTTCWWTLCNRFVLCLLVFHYIRFSDFVIFDLSWRKNQWGTQCASSRLVSAMKISKLCTVVKWGSIIRYMGKISKYMNLWLLKPGVVSCRSVLGLVGAWFAVVPILYSVSFQ